MPTSNLVQALLEIPLLIAEVEILQAQAKEGIAVTTPGIGASISHIPGKLSLTFTPNTLLVPAAASEAG
jgi:hypothetical protein